MLTRLLFVLPMLMLAGNALAEEPQWLRDARAREGKNLKAQSLRSADGFITATVRGRVLADVTENEGSYTITLDIGSEAPVNCEVVVDGFDLAEILRATSELTFKEVEPIQGKIAMRVIERTDAGAFASSPYMAMDWLYRVDGAEGARLGALKQIAAVKNGHGLYCAHLDLGYAKSFHDAVKSLVESVRFAGSGPAPYFTEISTASLGGAKVGVMIVTMERDEEGDSKLLLSTALAMRVAPDTLRTQDAVHVQWARPDGSLINASHVVSSNGELEANLRLTALEGAGWRVTGEFHGKSIDQKIETSEAPASWIEVAQARRQLFTREKPVGAELRSLQWTVADPTRLVDSRTTVLSVAGAGRLSARESVAGLTAEHVLDKATGMPVRTVVHVGPQSMELERVYVQGSF